jgi:ribosomal protein L36
MVCSVVMDDGSTVLAHLCAALHQVIGDKVIIEFSPYDTKKGRIVQRLKFKNSMKVRASVKKICAKCKMFVDRTVYVIVRIQNINNDEILYATNFHCDTRQQKNGNSADVHLRHRSDARIEILKQAPSMRTSERIR